MSPLHVPLPQEATADATDARDVRDLTAGPGLGLRSAHYAQAGRPDSFRDPGGQECRQ